MLRLNRRGFVNALGASLVLIPLGFFGFKIRELLLVYGSFNTILIKIQARLSLDSPLCRDEIQTLSRYIDLLVPNDETPGALAFEIDKDIFSKCTENVWYRRKIREGCLRINQLSKKAYTLDFRNLDEGKGLFIIEISEQGVALTPERILFDTLRRDVFKSYYSQPAIWQSLGYNGPPQPVGFPDYHLPVENKTS